MAKALNYLLDADTLIRAFRQHYRPAFCPAYWDALLHHHEAGRVASIVPVKRELLKGNDDLAKWVRRRPPTTFFKDVQDNAVVRQYRALGNWVQAHTSLNESAKAGFAAGADGWLVAYAQTNGFVVCTFEVSAPESRNRIKIPDIADAFGVACISPFDMLESLQVRMVLSKRSKSK